MLHHTLVSSLLLLTVMSLIGFLQAQIQFEDFFSSCKKTDPRFDNCIRDALNSVRPYFKTGLPQYGVKPFDPFYAETVPQVMNSQFLSYRLMLRNVSESGWTQSQVTRFRSDFNKDLIEYTQFFPDKRLKGRFDFNGDLLGMQMKTSGVWSLNLFDFTQTTTVTRKPRMVDGEKMYDTPMKVNVNVQTCRHMELHISNLLGGRTLMENMLDRIINSAWPPGFLLLRPLINDLVSTGFTDIFNDDFRNFPFSEIIH